MNPVDERKGKRDQTLRVRATGLSQAGAATAAAACFHQHCCRRPRLLSARWQSQDKSLFVRWSVHTAATRPNCHCIVTLSHSNSWTMGRRREKENQVVIKSQQLGEHRHWGLVSTEEADGQRACPQQAVSAASASPRVN